MIKQLTIIGIGLIGGSLAQALKRAGAVEEIVGVDRDSAHLQRALELGVIDRAEPDPAVAVCKADVVLVSTPVETMEAVFRQIAPHLPAGAVLTDAGSTKGSVVEAACAAFGGLPANFVPGHPIAGTEKSGVEAAFAELFDGRRVILTPTEATDPHATARVRALWEQAGAKVTEISVSHHDQVLAATSHLPHLLAFALVDTLATLDEKQEVFEYAAGGFHDFTRIASSNPRMWRDICMHNESALLEILNRFEADLGRLRQAVANKDGEYLLDVFNRAKAARDQFCRDETPVGLPASKEFQRRHGLNRACNKT